MQLIPALVLLPILARQQSGWQSFPFNLHALDATPRTVSSLERIESLWKGANEPLLLFLAGLALLLSATKVRWELERKLAASAERRETNSRSGERKED